MEYEKIIISLVDKNESVKAFVCFYKRADELILEIKGVKEKGVFCVWANGKMAFYELNKYNQFILSDNFNFFNDYFFMIKTQSCLYGTKGNITDADLIIKKFNKVIENFNKEDCEKMKVSKTQFVESVINKMFAKSNQMFFEYTQNQLSRLFVAGKKCQEIENKIAHSKFVECGDEHSKSYFGIIYKNNIPYAICVGVNQSGIENLKHDNCYQYIQTGENSGVFLSARSSADGDLIIIN